MKRVSNAIKSFVLSSSCHHLIPQRQAFSKYLFVLLLAGMALFINGCQKDELQGSLQRQDLLNSSQKQELKNQCVPFKGKLTTSPTATGVTGTGEASHIGRFTLVAYDQVSFPNITGTTIITAANGDQIFVNHAGLITPLADNMVNVHLENTITGGTGRFAGATGRYSLDGLVNATLGTGDATLNGTICY